MKISCDKKWLLPLATYHVWEKQKEEPYTFGEAQRHLSFTTNRLSQVKEFSLYKLQTKSVLDERVIKWAPSALPVDG